MFASLRKIPLRHRFHPMTVFHIRPTWTTRLTPHLPRTLLFCRASLDPRTNTTRTIRIMLAKFTIQPTELGLLLNHLRNGLVADATSYAIGFIVLGSTTRPFPGIIMTSNTTNLQPAILLTIIQLPNGLRFTHECGAPGVGNLCFLPRKASPFGHNANATKPPFVPKKKVLPLPNNSATHLLTAGAKRDRLWTIWSISVYSIKLKPSCRISPSLMFPRYLCFRAYPLHSKNNSLAALSTLSLRIGKNFTKPANHMSLPSIRTAHPQLLRPLLPKLLPSILSPTSPTRFRIYVFEFYLDGVSTYFGASLSY